MNNISMGLIEKFNEYLDQLIEELNQYSAENLIWEKTETISNSAGNLTLHLIGNLNHFIGAVLGATGYIRERHLEFSITFTSRAQLISSIEKTKEMIENSLASVSDDAFMLEYPFTFNDDSYKPTTYFWMLQIITHLAYHVGQINYHRRLISNKS